MTSRPFAFAFFVFFVAGLLNPAAVAVRFFNSSAISAELELVVCGSTDDGNDDTCGCDFPIAVSP
jgi:hypothetical protein